MIKLRNGLKIYFVAWKLAFKCNLNRSTKNIKLESYDQNTEQVSCKTDIDRQQLIE